MKAKVFVIMVTAFFSFVFGNGIEVHSRLASGSLFGNEINLHLRIYNNSNEKLDLSKVNLTYRFSDHSSLDKLAYNIWWFSNGSTSDARISFQGNNTEQKSFNISFLSGEIERGKYAEIQLRVHKTDWSFFDMADDYSLPLSGMEWAINPDIDIVINDFFLDIPILPPQAQSGKADWLEFSDMLLSLSDYSVFGTNEVRLADRVSVHANRTEIHGSVGTGNYAEIGTDNWIIGSLHSKKNAFLRERAQLFGNLRVGENYNTQNFVSIDGEKLTGKPIPDFKLPSEKDLKIGTADIFVGNHEKRYLEPGAYKDLTAYSNSELYLKPGKYIFRNLRLEPETKLNIDVSSGVIEIYALETITFSDRLAVSYANGYANPLAFKVYQHGSSDLRIGTDLNMGGYFIAPNATIRVSSRVRLAGWLHGKNVSIEPDVNVCEPPTLSGLTHSGIAYAPYFSALNSEYRTAKSGDLEVFANAKDKNTTVNISRSGNKYSIKLYNSAKANINPWCAQTEYSLAVGSGGNSSVYVKENSECSGNSCDGTRWSRAFKTLQKGLELAKMDGKAIWLAEGNYNILNDSLLKIEMGTEIRGGFAGENDETLESRKGDINNVRITGNGSSSLLFLGGSGLSYAAYMDMATVTKTNILSVYAAPVLDYLVIRDNDITTEGGGIYSVYSDGLKISNSYIVGNKAALGGGLYVKDGSLALENAIVSANRAENGAAIYAENAKLKIRHSTIADNSASVKGIAFVGNVSTEAVNNIVWNNGGSDLETSSQNPLFNSDVAAGEDGLFFTMDDGYGLTDDSPMIDKGIVLADIPLDIFQMDRTISKDESGLPDMGAREWFPDLSRNFAFLVKNSQKIWEGVEKPTIIHTDADDYYPTALRNSWSSYNFSIKVAKNRYMKNKHYANVRVIEEDSKKACGESRKFAFYRIAEENGIVEYRTYKDGSTFGGGEGRFMFFAEREMPSYDWYHVLKTCESSRFRIEVEVLE